MWLRLIPIACFAACAGGVPPTTSGAEHPSATEPEPGFAPTAVPEPDAAKDLDERTVDWVEELRRRRGRIGLEAVVDGGAVEERLRFAQARAVLGRTVEAEQVFRQVLAVDANCAAAGQYVRKEYSYGFGID